VKGEKSLRANGRAEAQVVYLYSCVGQCGRLGRVYRRRTQHEELEVCLCLECFVVWDEAWSDAR
jgi:hypothetical protein